MFFGVFRPENGLKGPILGLELVDAHFDPKSSGGSILDLLTVKNRFYGFQRIDFWPQNMEMSLQKSDLDLGTVPVDQLLRYFPERHPLLLRDGQHNYHQSALTLRKK